MNNEIWKKRGRAHHSPAENQTKNRFTITDTIAFRTTGRSTLLCITEFYEFRHCLYYTLKPPDIANTLAFQISIIRYKSVFTNVAKITQLNFH